MADGWEETERPNLMKECRSLVETFPLASGPSNPSEAGPHSGCRLEPRGYISLLWMLGMVFMESYRPLHLSLG